MTIDAKLRKTLLWAGACLLIVMFGCVLATSTLVSAQETGDQAEAVKAVSKVNQDVAGRPIETVSRGYVTSDNCRECHAEHYDSWHSSHHRTMTQVPTKDSVIADFDDKVLSHSGREFRFFHKDDEYFMEMKTPRSLQGDATSKTFKIVLSTGAHHQQAFWCETGKKRTLAKIPFIWITKEQRWIPYGAIFVMPSSGLSMHAGIWNSNCIKCHVVGGQPRLDRESGFDTHVAEFGISCEACHGPGEAHVAHHENVMDDDPERSTVGNEKLVDPGELSHRKSSQACGQCHAVFDFYDAAGKSEFLENGFPFRPGDELVDSRHVFRHGHDEELPIVQQKLKHNPKFWEQQFWSDGMVRVSGREYNGLLETACFQRGTMSCLSCHDMHPKASDSRPTEQWADDQMKLGMRGNDACLQCHENYKSEQQLAKHTHHAAGSAGSNCYNCHMPHTTLGLMKAMRSHTIDSPSVAATVATGRPNACNLCHLDQTLAWTAEYLEKWYQIPKPKLSEEEKEVASSVRWILKGDAGQRTIAGWHFGWKPAQEVSGTRWMAPYLAELLTDSYDVARFTGYHSLKELPEFSEFEYDFVGSEEARQRGKQSALQLWNELPVRPSPSKSLLIDEQKVLNKRDFQNLREQRLDPTVILVE